MKNDDDVGAGVVKGSVKGGVKTARTAQRSVPTSERGAHVKSCRHCGAPSPGGEEFCCGGCAYVFRLIHDEGLDAYYKIKDEVTVPADVSLSQPRDYAWLETAVAEAEEVVISGAENASTSQSTIRSGRSRSLPRNLISGKSKSRGDHRAPSLVLEIQGISCAGCVWLIEKLFMKQAGAGRLEVNAQTGQMRWFWEPGKFNAVECATTLQRFNYIVGPAGSVNAQQSESRVLIRRVGLCTAFAMNVMLFALPAYFGMSQDFEYAPLFRTLQLVFATLSLLAGGGYFIARAVRALRERVLHIDLPIALGIVGAYVGSLYGWLSGSETFLYFDFVSAFIVLMLVGRWAQVAAVERNQRRLLSRQPVQQRVRVIDDDGGVHEAGPEAIKVGERFEVLAGQMIPVEARLETAEASLSLAWINGEAEPRVFRGGQRVMAGAQNAGRACIRLVATQAWADSLLAELLKPVERAAEQHRLIERVIRVYLVLILAVAALAGLSWGLATQDFLKTGAVVTAVLVVSCPCALGLAFPLTEEIATVALRRRGIFVRAGDLWARLRRVKMVVFDKTGTLTLDTPVLANPRVLELLDAEERAALLALVRDNPHPVSRALHETLLASGWTVALPGDVVETIGQGVALGEWTLGRGGWRATRELFDPDRTEPVPPGKEMGANAELVLARNGEGLVQFQFTDTARADAREELSALLRRGLEIVVLSGDRKDKVAKLMAELRLPEGNGYGELTPREKAAWLKDNATEVRPALMLGDGANDSLAFDNALCRGTPVVHRGVLQQKADFYYLGRGIAGIRALFEINDARHRTQIALLVFMVAYNVFAVGLAVSGRMNPLVAACLMPLSSLATLLIVAWGMRCAWRRAGEGRLE